MKLAVAAIVVFSISATLVSGDSGGLRQMMQNCPQYEVYKTCASSCPETCDNYGQPIRCNKRCAPAGCFCDVGYVREDDTPGSACIPPANCPPKCPANEVYQTCGTACPATCSTKDAIRPCIAMCAQGCFCKDGYVRDDDTDVCVRSEDCPSEQTATTTTTTTTITTTTTTSSTGSD